MGSSRARRRALRAEASGVRVGHCSATTLARPWSRPCGWLRGEGGRVGGQRLSRESWPSGNRAPPGAQRERGTRSCCRGSAPRVSRREKHLQLRGFSVGAESLGDPIPEPRGGDALHALRPPPQRLKSEVVPTSTTAHSSSNSVRTASCENSNFLANFRLLSCAKHSRDSLTWRTAGLARDASSEKMTHPDLECGRW